MKTKNIILTIIILAILAAGFLAIKDLTGNVVKDESKKEIALENTCECIERENIKCPGEYELMDEKRLCEKVSEKCFQGELNLRTCEPFIQYSPVLLSCSKYDCDGEIWRVK